MPCLSDIHTPTYYRRRIVVLHRSVDRQPFPCQPFRFPIVHYVHIFIPNACGDSHVTYSVNYIRECTQCPIPLLVVMKGLMCIE